MEGMKMEEPSLTPTEDADICTSILTHFGNSTRVDHQHLCAVIGGMAQGFKDQNVPSSPVAYFGAACSSLDRLLSEPEPSSGHMIDALLTILSMAMRKVSPAILVKKSDLLTRILLLSNSNSLTVAGAVSALKCISHLLILNNNNNWSQLYGFLLSFATDSRPKVRRQSHLRLRDVLQSFQGTWQLAPASAGIADLFKRFLVLASGKDTQGPPKGAMEMLFFLDCLKECIALMSTMCKNDVLQHLKSLLELNQPPLVTRRITNILYRLCLNPCPDVAPQILIDLLCSLSLSLSNVNDDMTFTARLLHVGMAKVYSLNKKMCVIKLPTVFTALRDILGSKHEEATHAAVNTFKSLIHACIDESLIKEGVDQFVMMKERRSGPTIIEKVCATIENLVGYHYTSVLDLAFQVVSAMFDKLGVYSCYFMRGTLKSLADMAKLPDEDFLFRKQLHKCLGTALVAMGPETFLGFLPLNLEAEDLSEVNVWLFPILKQYTIGARLSFFTESILGMVEVMSNKPQQLQSQGRIFSSRCTDELIYSLWSLLPSFCHYPSDTAESFNDLKQALCGALGRKPEIRGIICLSLQILVQQNKKIPEEVNDLSDSEVGSAKKRAMANYTHQVTADNLSVLKSSAHEILTVLSDVFLETTKDESTKDETTNDESTKDETTKDDGGKHTKDDGGCLQSTIGEFASIADEQTLAKLLLDKCKDRNSMKRALLFDLAVSFLPGLDAEAVDVLFTYLIKPGLQHAGGLIQKKAYKALSIILGDFDGFISSKLEELLGLMVELLPSCHFSARRHRLDCLYLLIVHVSKSETEQRRHDIISSFLTEIILGLKETNKKTRNKAYYTLVQIGHIYGDEEKGGTKESLHQFFNMVAGGLAGETPVIISAAMRGLARLAYEFSDLVSTASNLLPSTYLLLQRKNREIIKASLCLLKVLVAKSQAEGLQLHLKSIVEALLKWQDDTKTNFKAKINLLLEMLVRKCGLDAVKAVMPQEHMKLLTNIRKIKERKERKQHASKFEEAKSLASKATTARLSRWNHSKVFSDFDDEETDDYMDAQTVTGGRVKASKLKSKACSLRSKCSRTNKKLLADHLFDELEDEPLDLLDGPRTMSALGSLKRKMESDEEPEIDPDGRLIIGEEANSKPSHPDSDAWSEAGTKKVRKRRKTSECGWASSGNVYGSNKAGVDLKKKKRLFEPYAYWALDRKMMSTRPEHRAAARKGISSILSSKRFKFKRVHKRKISK